MYKMAHYTEHDRNKMLEFMQQHSFATVIGMGKGFPEATQLPLEITEQDGKILLKGHMMRKTSHHLAFEENNHVLVLFQSPHAYINAGWYENPQQGSTVNYMTVQVKGAIHFTGESGTYEAIKNITNKHIGTGTPASFENIPDDYKQQMMKAITGFSIEVLTMESVFKLSQNRHINDQQSIIAKLESRQLPGDVFIAAEMKKRIH